MIPTRAYPGCGWGFERQRSEAHDCAGTYRTKARQHRARAQREWAGRRQRGERGAPVAGPAEDTALAERLAAFEHRLAAAEGGVARAEPHGAGGKTVRDQLQAALALDVLPRAAAAQASAEAKQ